MVISMARHYQWQHHHTHTHTNNNSGELQQQRRTRTLIAPSSWQCTHHLVLVFIVIIMHISSIIIVAAQVPTPHIEQAVGQFDPTFDPVANWTITWNVDPSPFLIQYVHGLDYDWIVGAILEPAQSDGLVWNLMVTWNTTHSGYMHVWP